VSLVIGVVVAAVALVAVISLIAVRVSRRRAVPGLGKTATANKLEWDNEM
jgi:hypothetical protein